MGSFARIAYLLIIGVQALGMPRVNLRIDYLHLQRYLCSQHVYWSLSGIGALKRGGRRSHFAARLSHLLQTS